jgi:hypothetical protein
VWDAVHLEETDEAIPAPAALAQTLALLHHEGVLVAQRDGFRVTVA